MSWTDPNESVFEDADVLTEANLLTSVLDNLTHLSRGARVFHSVAQSINTATATALTFDSERYDADGFHSLVSNQTRLTVPASAAGRYLIGGHVVWSSLPSAAVLQIRLNGTTMIAVGWGGVDTSGGTVETVYDLAVSDYVELIVTHTTGSARSVNAVANQSPEFWIQGVGGT